MKHYVSETGKRPQMETVKNISNGSSSKGAELWSQICNEVLNSAPPHSKFTTVNFHGESIEILNAVIDGKESTFVTLEGVVHMLNRLENVLKTTFAYKKEEMVRKLCNVRDSSEFDGSFEANSAVIKFSELTEDFYTRLTETSQGSDKFKSLSPECMINDTSSCEERIALTQEAAIPSFQREMDVTKNPSTDLSKDNGETQEYSEEKRSSYGGRNLLDQNVSDKTVFMDGKNHPDKIIGLNSTFVDESHNYGQINSIDSENLHHIRDLDTSSDVFYEDLNTTDSRNNHSKITIDFNSENIKGFYDEEAENSMFSKLEMSESRKNDYLYLTPQPSDPYYHPSDVSIAVNHDNIHFDYSKQWQQTAMDACFMNNQMDGQKVDFKPEKTKGLDNMSLFEEYSDDNGFSRNQSPLKKHFSGPSNGARPFICHFRSCNRAFKRFEHLKRHYRIHTGERPFKCKFPGCQKSFARSDNLNQHLKVHNSGISFAPDQRSNGFRYTDKN